MMFRLAKNRWALVAVICSLFAFAPNFTSAQSISSDQLQQVVARLAEGATHSWELGTRAQALLELNAPFYSVFSGTTLPPPTSPSSSSIPANLTDVISIARNTVSLLNNTTGPQPLVANDGAAGDPASIGVAVLLANWTNASPAIAPPVNATETHTSITKTTSSASPTASTSVDNSTATATSTASPTASTSVDNSTATTTSAASPTASASVDNSTTATNTTATNVTVTTPPSYAEAAGNQLQFLLFSVPRTSDGAISHRVSQVQLWSDFVYMVPPFLAYYGVMTQATYFLAESYSQIKLYRNYLRNSTANNLWMHIAMGTGTDDGHWSTGNAWAAAGMLRVLATIKHSNFAIQFESEQMDLQNWVIEILDGMYSQNMTNNIFHNYADNTSTFSDCSSTALIAASTYRLAVLTQTYKNIPNAEKSRQSLSDGSHIDSNGWLTPVVNPENFVAMGAQSPEGQAFVVEMQAAWQDWVAVGSPGVSSAHRAVGAVTLWSAVITGLVAVVLALALT